MTKIAAANPNDQLLAHLIELQRELDAARIPLILGGGMSLYLRLQYLPAAPSSRYPFTAETRSTSDLDLFLTGDLIVDAKKVGQLRDIISHLGYVVDPNAKNFQFTKEVTIHGGRRAVRVELLAAPPSDKEKDKVEVRGFRIKPVGAEEIHAYLTESAGGLDIGNIQVSISASPTVQATVTIPSAYNYLILKLHAFDDRKGKKDAKSDEGRHHAYDIFATVSRMDEADWKTAATHLAAEGESDYLRRAAQIQRDCFGTRTSVGMLRLQENEVYRRHRDVYDSYLDQLIQDLNDLFNVTPSRRRALDALAEETERLGLAFK